MDWRSLTSTAHSVIFWPPRVWLPVSRRCELIIHATPHLIEFHSGDARPANVSVSRTGVTSITVTWWPWRVGRRGNDKRRWLPDDRLCRGGTVWHDYLPPWRLRGTKSIRIRVVVIFSRIWSLAIYSCNRHEDWCCKKIVQKSIES